MQNVYRSILIVENEIGIYSPAIDRSIESPNLDDIIEWIDNFWSKALEYKKDSVVSQVIIGEYLLDKPFLEN